MFFFNEFLAGPLNKENKRIKNIKKNSIQYFGGSFSLIPSMSFSLRKKLQSEKLDEVSNL